MNSVWYKFRSAATWRELQIPSTFITIGEMRQLICKELHLQEQETVLLSENGDDNYRPLADEKQFPRGSRFWARRTTFDHINREQRVQEQTQRANDAQTGVQDSTPAQEYSDDDFGPDLFDRAAQLKYEERERLEAIADQHKLELEQKAQQTEQAEEQAWDSNGEAAAAANSVEVKDEAKFDPKRTSMRLIEEPDYMEIDWARLIEERKVVKAGDVKQEPSEALASVEEHNACTTVATASQSIAAAPEAGAMLDAAKRVSSPPPEQPAVLSLLQICPALLDLCQHILPDAPLEHLYLAFPNTRPRKRADWKSFQKQLKERAAAAECTKTTKPPATPPPNSQRSSSIPRPDISPAASPPASPGGKRWEPSPQPGLGHDSASHQPPGDEQQRGQSDHDAPHIHASTRPPRPPFHPDAHPSNSGAARSPRQRSHSRGARSPSPASHHHRWPHCSRSPAPPGRHRSGQPRSRSPVPARDCSGPYERFRSRSPARMHGTAPGDRTRSRPQQDLRYASDSYRDYRMRQSPSGNRAPSSRGGMRGVSDRGGAAAEPSRSDANTARMTHRHVQSRSQSRSPQRAARPQAQNRAGSSSDSSDSSSSRSRSRSQSPPRARSPAKQPPSRGNRMSSRSASPQKKHSHVANKRNSTAAPITERMRSRSNVRHRRSQTPPSVSKGASQGSIDESPRNRSGNRKKQHGGDRGALARRALGGLIRS